MKKIFLITIILNVTFTAAVFAMTFDEKIKWIKKNFTAAEKYSSKNKPVVVKPSELETYKCYKKGRGFAKITSSLIRESSKKSEKIDYNYYYNNNAVYFIFIKTASKNIKSGKMTYREERIYFYHDSIIRALIKESDRPNMAKVENDAHTEVAENIQRATEYYIDYSSRLIYMCEPDSVN